MSIDLSEYAIQSIHLDNQFGTQIENENKKKHSVDKAHTNE